MPDWIVNLAGSYLGLKTLWEKIDGYKTYISGAARMMTGLGGILLGAAGEADAFVENVHNIADAFHFVQNLVQHPDAPALAISAAWLVVLNGWHIIAEKHAEDKAAELAARAKALPLPNAPTPAPAPPEASKQ